MTTNDPMTQERLDAIQARVDARTPGQWEASGREIEALAPSWCEVVSAAVDCMNHCYGGTGRGVERAEDADLIAHAPQDLTDLLAEVERLRALLTVDDAMVERALRQSYGPKAWQDMCDSEDDYDVALVSVSRDEMWDTLNAAHDTGEGS